MEITTEQVKTLRDQTGVSVMQCRKALEEAEGDMDKALLILKKKSADIAAKKSDREAADGTIAVKGNDTKAVMLILNCETDFVAKNDEFMALAKDIAEKAFADGEESAKEYSKGKIEELVQKIGENIQLGSLIVASDAVVGSYAHYNGKTGVIVTLSGGTPELAKDLAMHIAAYKPTYTTAEEVPAEMRAKIEDLFAKEVAESDKPEEMKAKILQGKIDAYLKEQTLLEQAFVKDGSKTVKQVLKEAGDVSVNKFVLYTI
jgi:elongation factor Ts